MLRRPPRTKWPAGLFRCGIFRRREKVSVCSGERCGKLPYAVRMMKWHRRAVPQMPPVEDFVLSFTYLKKNDKSKISFFHDQFFFSFRAIQGVMETQPKMFCPTLIFPSLPSCKQAKAAKPSRSDFTPEPLQY